MIPSMDTDRALTSAGNGGEGMTNDVGTDTKIAHDAAQVVPNPGSAEALALGCTCPVLDNRHGAGLDYPDGPAFWIACDCPIHGKGNDDE